MQHTHPIGRYTDCGNDPRSGKNLCFGLSCNTIAPGTYTIAPQDPGCEGPDDLTIRALTEGYSGEFSEYEATGGTLTITEVGECIVGAFELTFSAGSMAGTFGAGVCQ